MTINGIVTNVDNQIHQVLDNSLHYYIVVFKEPPPLTVGDRVEVTGECKTMHYLRHDFADGCVEVIEVS